MRKIEKADPHSRQANQFPRDAGDVRSDLHGRTKSWNEHFCLLPESGTLFTLQASLIPLSHGRASHGSGSGAESHGGREEDHGGPFRRPSGAPRRLDKK